MRKILCIAALFLGLASYGQGDGLRLGTRFMVGTSSFEGSQELYQSQPGRLVVGGGIIASYQLSSNIGLGLDILLDSKGTRFYGQESTTFGSEDFTHFYRNTYLSIPIYPTISFGGDRVFLKIYGGLAYNALILATEERRFDDGDYNSNNGYNEEKKGFENSNMSIVGGAGLEVEASGGGLYFIELRISKDASDIGRITRGNDSFAAKQTFIGVSFGTRFRN